jgi:hypothetical protein
MIAQGRDAARSRARFNDAAFDCGEKESYEIP